MLSPDLLLSPKEEENFGGPCLVPQVFASLKVDLVISSS